MFVWGLLKRGIPESVRFCIGDLPMYIFFIPTHPYIVLQNGNKNSIRDARTPQPGEIFFNTMRYRSSVTVQSTRYFQSSISYIKVQIMLK